MKRLSILMLLLLVPAALAAQTALVVDHRCTNPDSIPSALLDSVRARFRIGYGHTSHGSQLVTGWEALRSLPGGKFAFTSSSGGLTPGTVLNDYWPSPAGGADLGAGGDLTWRNATRAMLNLPNNDRNVVIWSWCGGVSSNTNGGIDTYLFAMDSLEKQYPKVRFVYMTGHLDGSGTAGTLHQMNNRIRQYCTTHGKTLFDFADIESYAPGSGEHLVPLSANDNCDYDSDGNQTLDKNWAQTWIATNPSSKLATLAAGCGDCAHSQRLNCVLKGTAFWWLLARMAGWSGTTGTTDISTNTLPAGITLYPNYPNPFNPTTKIQLTIVNRLWTSVKVIDVFGRDVASLLNEMKDPGTYTLEFNGAGLASGVYYCRLQSGKTVQVRKMMLVK